MTTRPLLPRTNLLFYIPYDANFGDELNVLLAKRLIETHGIRLKCISLRDKKWHKHKLRNARTMSFLGSIMHLLPETEPIDIIGTGVNPLKDHNNLLNNPSIKVLALRGELSKSFMEQRGFDTTRVVLGDPALLIPRLYPEWLNPYPGSGTVFIPHYNDIEATKNKEDNYKRQGIEVCYPNQRATDVINVIMKKKTIVSSSLHGIIVAEMLQKDTRWLMLHGSIDSESEFKYRDYFSVTGRPSTQRFARCLAEALSPDYKLPPCVYDDTELFNLVQEYFLSPIEEGGRD